MGANGQNISILTFALNTITYLCGNMTATDRTTQDKYEALTKLTEGDFKAFLYDCDGTLADTMPGHKKSYVRVAAEDGIALEDSIIDEFAGLPIHDVIVEINKRYNSTFDPVDFAGASITRDKLKAPQSLS